jgi:hypothetical protein
MFFPEPIVHPDILFFLEFFEIVNKWPQIHIDVNT